VAASPAAAQVGIAASIFSDDRFRGYSLSDDRPVAILDVSYDSPDGLYAAVSGSAVATRHDGIEPLGLQLNGGYATRLASGLTLDLGVVHSRYSHYSSRGPAKAYTEVYAGIAGKVVSGRLSVSPDYLNRRVWTAYGEVNTSVPAAPKFRLTGHIGFLVPLKSYQSNQAYRSEFDWRVGVARDFGRMTLSAAWAGVRRGRDIYQEATPRHSGLILGLTYAL
jgi:uncharacterized protein (TIGR02001 family)